MGEGQSQWSQGSQWGSVATLAASSVTRQCGRRGVEGRGGEAAYLLGIFLHPLQQSPSPLKNSL